MDYRKEKLRLVVSNELKLLIKYSQEVEKQNCCWFFCIELLADNLLACYQVLLLSAQLESNALCCSDNLIKRKI